MVTEEGYPLEQDLQIPVDPLQPIKEVMLREGEHSERFKKKRITD